MSVPVRPSYDEFLARTATGNLIPIPVRAELMVDFEDPLSAFEKVGDGRSRFLLESAEATGVFGSLFHHGRGARAIQEIRAIVE